MKALKLAIITLVAATTLAACAPRVSVHGNYPRPEQLAVIEKGKSDQRTIFEILGPPTTEGTFDQLTWYYISQRFERFAFYEPEMTDLKIYAFYFNDQGIYVQDQTFDLEDLKQIAINEETTPTAGHELNFFQQMFGNFGKFN